MNFLKNKKLSIIFWLIIVAFIYFTIQYLFSEFSYQQTKRGVERRFSNIESKIYENIVGEDENKKNDNNAKIQPQMDNAPLNYTNILLKQQLQISQLQNNYDALRVTLGRIKINDNLPKIILSFIKLINLVELKKNHDQELKKLELLCRADFVLSKKISILKKILQSQPKNNQELSENFINLIPIIKAKEIEVTGNNNWSSKIKSTISKFVTIKRTDKNSIDSDLELLIVNIYNTINNRQYDLALKNIENISDEYQNLLFIIKMDLQNTALLQKTKNDIYQYLENISDV